MIEQSIEFDLVQASAMLGVSATATEQELRSAYLLKVQQHPPDRDPETFELIRDAYDQLRNPNVRAKTVLLGSDPFAPLPTLLDGLPSARQYIGSALWIELLKEKRS